MNYNIVSLHLFIAPIILRAFQMRSGSLTHARITRITHDPNVMGGKPCIRGLRVTVGAIVGLVAAGHSHEEILRLYPYLAIEDIRAALSYAAWRVEEFEVSLTVA